MYSLEKDINNISPKNEDEDKNQILSDIYKEIFKTYLEFYPYFRRNLVELSGMYEWFHELRLKIGILEPDFFILMEWFNSLNLIKPICVLHFPPEHNHHICYNDNDKLVNRYNNSNLKQFYDEGLISFPDAIYNIKASENLNVEKWVHKKIEYKIMIKSRNAKDDDPEEEKISVEETRYLYHPIQFFQILTNLRGTSHKNLKNFKKFYWNRRLDFDDYPAKNTRNYLKKENKQLKEFIQETSSNGLPFDQFKWLFYIQNRWLIGRSLKLWIKIESFLAPIFYYKRGRPNINMQFQISENEWYDKDKYRNLQEKYYNWREDVNNNFDKYFSIDEYLELKKFRETIWLYTKLDGLEEFIDLFLHISDDKKAKLKGFPNYWINMVQIYTMLKIMEDRYFSYYSELAEHKTELKWYDPKYIFKENELSEHKKKIFLDYGLTQEETYIVFVEGPADAILLRDWTDLIFYRTGIRINIKELGGRRNKFIFEYLTKEFEINEFFLVLDQDTEDYAKGLKSNLMGKGISEEAFHIFYPDFITANFTAEEIYEAFLNYFKDLKEKNDKKSEIRLELKETDKQKVLKRLKDKQDSEKYEDIAEECLKIILKNASYEFKKTKFAKYLLDVIRKNLSMAERKRKYPFEEILGKFVSKIQKKKYPGSDIFSPNTRVRIIQLCLKSISNSLSEDNVFQEIYLNCFSKSFNFSL